MTSAENPAGALSRVAWRERATVNTPLTAEQRRTGSVDSRPLRCQRRPDSHHAQAFDSKRHHLNTGVDHEQMLATGSISLHRRRTEASHLQERYTGILSI